MMPIRLTCIALAAALFSTLASSQGQQTGTTDYVLGNSSVMWLPRSTALFSNPGELARLHQDEFSLSSSRFNYLNSMSGAFFLPGIGTVGLGVSPSYDSTKYTLGYGGLVGDYHDFGTTISLSPKVQGGFRFAFGGALHLPTSVRNSGFHLGATVTDLPLDADFTVGAAYWIIPDIARVQLAARSHVERAVFLGAEVQVLEGFNVQAGARGFKKILGGISYETSYVIAALGAGPEGISFSMNFRIGKAASTLHDAAYSEGEDAFDDGRYSDARDSYLTAIRYDEYDEVSRQLVGRSQSLMDSLVTALLSQAKQDESQNNFAGAMQSYAQIVKIDPHQSIAASNLAHVERKFREYVQSLLATGDSLRDKHKTDEARRTYELVLDLQPDNDSASVRIEQLDALAKENIRTILSHAQMLLRRGRLDEAEKEFNRVLENDPNDGPAKSGLRIIAVRRLDSQLAQAKTAYDERRYFDALEMLLGVIDRSENNSRAKELLEKTRDALKSESDKLFKAGLQFYIKEDFRSAIAEWDKVLMIAPSDSSTREYRKRAEEKLKALEQYN